MTNYGDLTLENTFEIESGLLIFNNIKGRATEYTAKGNRYFAVRLTVDQELTLIAAGWNVKHNRRDGLPYLPVKVRPHLVEPKVIVRGVVFTPEEYEMIPEFGIRARLSLWGFSWSNAHGSGIVAVLNEMEI